jgi:hypothetical protein
LPIPAPAPAIEAVKNRSEFDLMDLGEKHRLSCNMVEVRTKKMIVNDVHRKKVVPFFVIHVPPAEDEAISDR